MPVLTLLKFGKNGQVVKEIDNPLMRIRNPRWCKKERGKRRKEYHTVKITDITPEGFYLHNMGKSYYVKRTKYPWFLDATNDEIHDVVRSKGWDAPRKYVRSQYTNDDDYFMWGLLNWEIPVRWFDNPEFKVHNVQVRGVDRPDLFAKSDYAK